MDQQTPRTPHRNRGRGGRRGRGRGDTRSVPLLPKPPGNKKFAKSESMRTAKSMADNTRQKTQKAAEEEYLGRPPADANLFQARLVLPGGHLLPQGLDEPEALHEIRRAHQVYITNVKPNVLDIQCGSIARLQEAIKAINWAIHDMRLSNDHPTTRFLLQQPTNAYDGGMIKITVGSRPFFISKNAELLSNATAMDEHVPKMTADLLASAQTLTTLNKVLSMRIVFGHFIMRSKKKNLKDEISKNEFVNLLSAYSNRGGATFEPRLPNASQAETLLQCLIKPANGICQGVEDIVYNCNLTFTLQGKEITMDILTNTGHGLPLLGLPRAKRPESWARLNWTFAAPDMQHDWTFRVDAFEKSADLPFEFSNLAQKIVLEFRDDKSEPTLLQFPRIHKLQLGDVQSQFTKICMKRTATIPFKDTPYMIEINVSKTWDDTRVSSPPELTWGIELFGVHWQEIMNHIDVGQRKKNWGEGLQDIWPGSEDLDVRFGQFMKTVLEVQAVLEGASPTIGSLLD